MTHIVALLLTAGLFGAGDRFDLVCDVPGSGGRSAAATTHVRFDLAKNLYCIDDCQVGQWIPAVKDVGIVLLEEFHGRHTVRTSILRNEDGQPVLHHSSPPDYWEGACEIKPFSGIPGADRLPSLEP